MPTLFHDLRFALRQMRQSPGLTLLAIVSLALGIGANTAIFTLIQNVLLRPLPYAHSDRLVFIGAGGNKPGFTSTSWLDYRDIQTQSRLMDQVAGYSTDVGVIEKPDGTESLIAPRITSNLFTMLGAQPLLGRTFTPAEGQSGGPQVAILSEHLWRKSFNADPAIIGKQVNISGTSRTIVGVMPASFGFPDEMGNDARQGVWLPIQPTNEMLHDRGYDFFNIVGELRPGATVQQAQHELDAIASRIPIEPGGSPTTFRADSYQQLLTGPVRPVLYGLFAALALVLLIACANVSNLLIARCLARRQEFAVRAALGAARLRLIRQMLAEGLALSLAGCAVGIALAQLAFQALHKLPQGTLPRADSIAIHWSVVLVLAAIAIIATVLSSVLPAMLVARSNPQAALQQASRGLGAHSVGGRLSRALVAGEVALSTLLLVGTGLLFHTLWNLEKSNLGFNTEHVTTFTAMPADAAGFSEMAVSHDTANAPPSVATLVYQPVLERMRSTPGVGSAALVTSPPLSGMNINSSFDIIGKPKDPTRQARVTAISSGYARTLGTPLVRGRMIGDSDGAGAPSVCIVNQALARKYFAGADALGKQVSLGGKDTGMDQPYTIVGILGDQIDRSVGGAIEPLILLPAQQIPTTSLFYPALLKTVVSFVVRTRGNVPVAPEMRAIFHNIAPGFALEDFQTMQQAVEKNTFNKRLGLYLLSSFAGLAVIMVIAGLYGVLSQLVNYRRREIGVRMALGATRGSVAKLILRQGSIVMGGGLAFGLVMAFATGRVIKSYLYQVHPLDTWTYAAVVLVLALIGLMATILPARKAASIEPMEALREE
ncbi:MAG TPA: ABC transporter permease [Terracidiphilus sp.]|nr:ABC transporter permease [Terracidiphilus sp.]